MMTKIRTNGSSDMSMLCRRRRRRTATETLGECGRNRTSNFLAWSCIGRAGRRDRPASRVEIARTIAAASPIAMPRQYRCRAAACERRACPAKGSATLGISCESTAESAKTAKSKPKTAATGSRTARRPTGRCLERIADALERLAPQPAARSPISPPPMPSSGIPTARRLAPVTRVNRVEMSLLKGIDRVRDILVENTERFATRPAGQQCAAVGRARHGQIVAGQGRACRDQRRARPRGGRSSSSRSIARTSKACPT